LIVKRCLSFLLFPVIKKKEKKTLKIPFDWTRISDFIGNLLFQDYQQYGFLNIQPYL
jgi:hypothetical protein